MGRYEELIEKRDGEGLTRSEANELGRLMAERKGRPYRNADDPPAHVEAERVSKDTEEFLDERREQVADVDDSVLTREGKRGRTVDAPPPA